MLNLIDYNQHIPAGVTDNSVEFFLHENEVHCMYNGHRYSFDSFPTEVVKIINDDMEKNPTAIASLVDWGLTTLPDQMRQYIACRHGGYDHRSDIDSDGIMQPAEYVNCGRRGSCPYEGKLCTAIQVSDNKYLTRSEVNVLREVGNGLLDKEIADVLCISDHTVRHHKDSICNKAGIAKKAQLAVLACRLGLISIN